MASDAGGGRSLMNLIPAISRSLPPVTAADRRGQTVLLPVAAAATAPSDAVAMEVVLEFQRVSGVQNEAYADGVTLILTDYGAGER